ESGIDVREFMNTWTRVIGIPIVSVTEADGFATVEQHRFLATNDVTPEEDETAILEGSDLVSLSDRAGLVADIASLSRSGHTSTSNLLDLVQYYKNEETYVVWELLAGRVGEIASLFTSDDSVTAGIKAFQCQLVDRMVAKLGWEFPEGEHYLQTRLRTVILRSAGRAGHPATVAEAKRRFAIFVSSPDQESILHPSIRQTAFEIVLSQGGEEEFRHVLNYFHNAPKQDQQVIALLALGFVKKPELIAEVHALSISEAVRPQDIYYVLAGLSANPLARKPTWEWVKANFQLLTERYKSSMSMLGACIKIPLSKVSDREIIRDTEDFFRNMETRDFQRDLDQTIETMNINAAYVERDQESLVQWLSQSGF
ncbi:hypothetical protein BGZ73_000832, partial [Actinomortierella ambigua]